MSRELLKQKRWQLPRRLVCAIRGHRWLQPFAVNTAQGRYVVEGCGRCGKNVATPAMKPNRETRRRIAKKARRKSRS